MQPIEKHPYSDTPNQSAQACISKVQAKVNQGHVKFVAVVCVYSSTAVDWDFAGSSGGEFAAIFGCGELRREIRDVLRDRRQPLNLSAPANRWVWNTADDPMSFDFHECLLRAELIRAQEQAPFPLRVHFHHPEPLNPKQQTFLDNVMRPMLTLIGAVEEEFLGLGARKMGGNYSYKPLLQAWKEGITLPTLHAPAKARLHISNEIGVTRPVTITLREAQEGAYRNSNLDEWIKFAEWLDNRCERVIFVRDTSKAEIPLRGFQLAPQCSKNLLLRMALYEHAKMNFFVSNGPVVLCWFSSAPWIMIHAISSSDPSVCNQPEGWENGTGIMEGEQFPFSNPLNQRIMWGPETCETMIASWEAFERRTKEAV